MRRLLVIDDHPNIRENIAEILALAGYDILTAETGRQGVALALQEKPDLVICDIMMPELDGFGVLHLLRKNPLTENIPFIFLTARNERSDFRRGMEMGADDYITKPFEEVELLSAIEVRLKKYDVLKTRYAIDKKGLSELMRDLNSSGLLKMKLDQYEGESMSKRAVLYQEGRRPRGLYYVRKGRVKAYRISEDGKEYITNFYTDGDFLGFLSILEGANHDDSAEVLEDAEIVMIPREVFVNAVYYDIAIATKFIRMIAQDVKEKEERLLNLAYDSLRKRVARALVDIHVKFGHLDISREEIAQYAGMATESLVRTLHDFKNEALVEIKEGRIRILDVQQLKNFSY